MSPVPSPLSLQAIHLVEKKLQMAIRGEYRTRMARGRRVSDNDKDMSAGELCISHCVWIYL